MESTSSIPVADSPVRTSARPAKCHPLYGTWKAIKGRCYNPRDMNYHRYGGKGVRLSREWRSNFWKFVEDVGERPKGTSLDRIDPEGNYCRENCRWASPALQNTNLRVRMPRPLSAAQAKALQCLVSGLSVKQSKELLGISGCAFNNHVKLLLAKTGSSSLFELGIWYSRHCNDADVAVGAALLPQVGAA